MRGYSNTSTAILAGFLPFSLVTHDEMSKLVSKDILINFDTTPGKRKSMKIRNRLMLDNFTFSSDACNHLFYLVSLYKTRRDKIRKHNISGVAG